MAVDELAKRLGRFRGWRREGGSLRSEGRAGRHVVHLVKPDQYMNRSGAAVSALLSEGWAATEILVVLDDVYLPLGAIRIRAGGGTGGHQGLESILEATGSEAFPRLRIGVGPPPPSRELPDYVLAKFTEQERNALPQVIEAAAAAAFDAAAEGLTQAMNRWNRFGRTQAEE